jgi:homoserine kinase
MLFSIERHPDNVAASLFGGFVGTYLNELKPEDVARKEIPLSEVLPAPAGGIDTGFKPPEPPLGIGHYRKFDWAPEIKAIAIIPDFVVPTANARNVLPQTYTRADVVREIVLSKKLNTFLWDTARLALPCLIFISLHGLYLIHSNSGLQPPTRCPPPRRPG